MAHAQPLPPALITLSGNVLHGWCITRATRTTFPRREPHPVENSLTMTLSDRIGPRLFFASVHPTLRIWNWNEWEQLVGNFFFKRYLFLKNCTTNYILNYLRDDQKRFSKTADYINLSHHKRPLLEVRVSLFEMEHPIYSNFWNALRA